MLIVEALFTVQIDYCALTFPCYGELTGDW